LRLIGYHPSVRLYLDLCCLKRPFDLQEHALVRLETEAIVELLAATTDRVTFIRSASHALENAYNTVKPRREAISYWLGESALHFVSVTDLRLRANVLNALGFGKFDSLHIGSAELASADAFVTVDYPLLRRAQRHSAELHVRVLDPLSVAEEVFGGTTDN
jgi:hypothetical protein